MGVFSDSVIPGAKLALDTAQMLLKGVEPGQFGRLAAPGGKTIVSNHPAFVYGHLSIYAPRAMALIGRGADALPNPSGFEELFKAGVECRDDTGGIYPSMQVVTEHYFAGHRRLIDALRATPDSVFGQANPMEGRMKEMFPTIGAAVAFLVIGHPMLHLGQVSAWRRAVGLPSAMG